MSIDSELLGRLKRSAAGPDDPAEIAGAPRFGPFALLREVGEGATARVFLAWDTRLKRPVALKILKIDSPATQRRFVKEAQLAARLRHPGVVTVYEVGESDGRPYIVLEFVEGAPLGERRVPIRRAVEIVRDAALAVHYAHSQGVIHRDLKPANILLGTDGKVYVTDFGLSKQLDPGAGFTATGVILGTPGYIPPEQAEGRNADVDAQSDVYGLGATLYELLTGRPPFDGTSVYDILNRVIIDEPAPLPPGVPADLKTVCLKAMAKDKRDRYRTAAELADDLQRVLDREPVLARPVSTLRMMALRVRRRPGRYLAAAGAALVLLAGAAVLLAVVRENRRLARERDAEASRVEAERRRLEAARRESENVTVLLQPLVEQVDRLVRRSAAAPKDEVERIAAELERVGRDTPRPEPWVHLGRLYTGTAEYDAAVRALDRAIERAPDSPLAYYWRGRARIEFYLKRMALPALSLSEAGFQAEVSADKGEMLDLRTSAVADFERVTRLNRALEDYYTHFARGAQAFGERRYGDAIAHLEVAVTLSNACPEAHFLLGLCRFYSSQYAKAIESIDRAWKEDFRSALMIGVRGLCIFGMARARPEGSPEYEHLMKQAIEMADQLLQLHDDRPDEWSMRGMLRTQLAQARLYAGGDPTVPAEGAIEDFTRAIAIERDDVTFMNRCTARCVLADHLLRNGKDARPLYREALADAEAAIAAGGSLAAFNARVDALYGLYKCAPSPAALEAAIAAAEELAKRDDAPPTAYLRYAQILIKRARDGDFALASESCGRALARNERYVTAYTVRADVLLAWAKSFPLEDEAARPKFQAAVDDADRAVKLEQSAATYAARGEACLAFANWLVQRMKRPPREYEQAVADYETSYQLSGFASDAANDLIVARLNRAMAGEARGLPVESEYRSLETFITEVIRRDPTEPYFYANRGHVRMQLKNWKGARDDFEEASRRSASLAADLADDIEKARRRLGE